MEFLESLKPSPAIRPQYNIGCLMDIPSGRYHMGKYGDQILNGGLAHITGICGRGNTFKTVILLFMFIRVLDRIKQSKGFAYDTEMTLVIDRLRELAVHCLHSLLDFDFENNDRFRFTDKTVYNGTEIFEWIKTTLGKREKDKMGKTPFLDRNGELLEALMPFLIAIDSLSQFSAANVLKIQDDGGIGESNRNVEALRDANAKTQLLMELPTLTARNGLYVLMTAHMGDDLALDPYAPPQKKLAFLKNKLKFKNVPEKFTFLVNNCWHAFNSEVLLNQATKAPEFPRNSDDDLRNDTDLQMVRIMNLRSKSGPTGLPFELIISQSDGVHVGLTEFNYIRSFGRFGLGGHDRSYFLDLCPDITLTRTTIRGKIDESPKLQRALEITSELCQITNLWHDVPKEKLCTPKQLYDDLIAKGYDWDELLATRGWWTFDDYNEPIKRLTTMDLLNMRLGEYKPYWMQ